MNKRTIAVILILMLLVTIVAIAGCGAQRRPGPVEPAPAPDTDRARDGMRNDEVRNNEDVVLAQRLADRISDMEAVNSASVVVTADRAWVGVDLRANTRGEITDEIKKEITNLVKRETDNRIATVYVTADADTVTRIRNIARDITDGKPISGFINELNEIGRRVTPSVR